MKRDTAIRHLQSHKLALRRLGATSLYLFGSTARNEATAASDIDVFIDYNPDKPFSLFDLMAIRSYLSKQLRRPVDVIPRDSFKKHIIASVRRDAIKVF